MFESQLEDSIVLKTGAAVGVGVGGKYVWFGALAQSWGALEQICKRMASKKNSKWRACRDAKVSTKSVGRNTNISLELFYAAKIIFLTIAFCAPMFPSNPFGIILPQCWSISLFTKDTCDWRVLGQDHSWDCHCGQLFCNLRPRGRVVTPVPRLIISDLKVELPDYFLCLKGGDQKLSHNLYETS